MLMRTTSHIVCCYDGDRAGREAAWRALENALPALKDGVKLTFLFLPDGEDPDTMVRQTGKDTFMALLDDAMPLSRFFFESLLKQHEVGTPEGKVALKAAAQPLIDQVLGDSQKAMLQEELAKHVGEYDRFRLQQDMQQAKQKSSKPKDSHYTQQKTQISPVRTMVRLLLDNPALAARHTHCSPQVLAQSGVAGIHVLIDIHGYCLNNPQSTTAQVLENFRDHPHSSVIAKLLLQEHLIKEDDADTVYCDSFAKLLDWHFDSRIETLISRSRMQPLSQEEKTELTLLMKERQKS